MTTWTPETHDYRQQLVGDYYIPSDPAFGLSQYTTRGWKPVAGLLDLSLLARFMKDAKVAVLEVRGAQYALKEPFVFGVAFCVVDDRAPMTSQGNDGDVWVMSAGDWAWQKVRGLWHRIHKISEMYGWPFDQEPEAPKPTEKSPADKALDEFIKRREAKRGGVYSDRDNMSDDQIRKLNNDYFKGEAESKALGNAMSKLTHWEMPFADRLTPYRGPNL